MGIFQQFPYTNFHELNLDEILKIVKENTDKINDFILDITDQIQEQVGEWIKKHPEYVTTVMDHSIKSSKFYSESVPFYNVLDYGVNPNGTDNYEQIHDLFANYVYYTGGIVFFPEGRYIISDTIFIPENTMVIGEGEKTEIFFDEQNTAYGVGLSNAGSGVTIKNIKVTQRTKSPFHSGSQPGCIGFSCNHKDMAISELNTTTFLKDNVSDLAAIDIYTDDSQYILQTENDNDYSIANVTYRNIIAPSSAVSVTAGAAVIGNVSIDNVICDVFRLSWNDSSGGAYENVNVNGIQCQTPILNTRNSLTRIIINSLKQTSNTRKNVVLASNLAGVIDGDITFNDCIFTTIASESNGIGLYYGIREFNNCTFNAPDTKAVTRNVGVKPDTNYEIMNDCVINCASTGSPTFLLGYGKNNHYDGLVTNMLWGDVHAIKQVTKLVDTISSVTPSVLNRIKVEGDKIIMQLYCRCASTDNILTLNALGSALLNQDSENMIPVVIFNSTTPDTQINTFAIFDSDVMKICETSYEASSAYDRVKACTIAMLADTPTIQQIYNLLA